MTACTQPGCTSTIVDNYCEVCGSPAAQPHCSLREAAASAESSAYADRPGLTAVPVPTPAPASVDEEIPTQRIPRVKMPRLQAIQTGDGRSRAADRRDADVEKTHGEKALAEDEPEGAHDYRTRVEEAQLPDDVRKVALCEVGKLNGPGDQSPESGEIRTWLDTISDLPWSTETTDWIDIQGSREVEVTLRRLIEPAVAKMEEGDAAEVEPVAADTEEGDTAEVEPVAADTEEGDTAEVEHVAADTEEGDTAEVEPVAADTEEGDTAEVEPVAADTEEGDTAAVEPVAADTEKADTAPTGLQHDDKVEMPAVPAVLGARSTPTS